MQVEGADVTVYRIKDPVSGDIPEQVRHHPKPTNVETLCVYTTAGSASSLF